MIKIRYFDEDGNMIFNDSIVSDNFDVEKYIKFAKDQLIKKGVTRVVKISDHPKEYFI